MSVLWEPLSPDDHPFFQWKLLDHQQPLRAGRDPGRSEGRAGAQTAPGEDKREGKSPESFRTAGTAADEGLSL